MARLGIGRGDFQAGGGIQLVQDLLNALKACF
jgi:hypothetical protein